MIELLKQCAQLFTFLVIVAPWEKAIRVRLGRHVQELGPGCYVRIPFVDRVFKQGVRRRLMNTRPQTVTTKDGRVVSLNGALGYSISDLRKLYDTLECAADTIENEASAALAHFIATRDLAQCPPPEVEKYVRENLKLERYGLQGQEFYLTSFAVARTYRFITGEMASWNHGGVITMETK